MHIYRIWGENMSNMTRNELLEWMNLCHWCSFDEHDQVISTLSALGQDISDLMVDSKTINESDYKKMMNEYKNYLNSQ